MMVAQPLTDRACRWRRVSLISWWSHGNLSQIALSRERASARQPLTDRPTHAERASESVAWIFATWPSSRRSCCPTAWASRIRTQGAPCWRSRELAFLSHDRRLRTAHWWGGTRSCSNQVISQTVPALSTNTHIHEGATGHMVHTSPYQRRQMELIAPRTTHSRASPPPPPPA